MASVSRFALDLRLAADTIPVGEMTLSRVLLMNDERFPWLILVPRRTGLTELTDLPPKYRAILMEEVAAASLALATRPGVDKINVGALGNMVRQLHIHVVARSTKDEAWPGPVWSAGARRGYSEAAAKAAAIELVQILAHSPIGGARLARRQSAD
jgi:diadenosine tetraphosphate (Ap4A) HIT family hydrolase